MVIIPEYDEFGIYNQESYFDVTTGVGEIGQRLINWPPIIEEVSNGKD